MIFSPENHKNDKVNDTASLKVVWLTQHICHWVTKERLGHVNTARHNRLVTADMTGGWHSLCVTADMTNTSNNGTAGWQWLGIQLLKTGYIHVVSVNGHPAQTSDLSGYEMAHQDRNVVGNRCNGNTINCLQLAGRLTVNNITHILPTCLAVSISVRPYVHPCVCPSICTTTKS